MSSLVKMHFEDNNVAYITISNNPVNALSKQLVNDLMATLKKVDIDNKINALILKSDTPNFCAGADLKERACMSNNEVIDTINSINDCFDFLASLKIITIAAINGAALGGGAELGLCCDFRIGTINSIVGFPEASIGIIPGAGGTYRLPRTIGVSKAKYWILSSRKFTGDEALEDGYFDFISEEEDLLEAAIDLADEITSNSKISIIQGKAAIDNFDSKSLRSREMELYKKTLLSKERKEFLEKFRKL